MTLELILTVKISKYFKIINFYPESISIYQPNGHGTQNKVATLKQLPKN